MAGRGRRITTYLMACLWVESFADLVRNCCVCVSSYSHGPLSDQVERASQMNYFAELRVGTNCFVLGAARQFIVWTVSFWTIVLTYNLYDSVMTLRCSNQQPATYPLNVSCAQLCHFIQPPSAQAPCLRRRHMHSCGLALHFSLVCPL